MQAVCTCKKQKSHKSEPKQLPIHTKRHRKKWKGPIDLDKYCDGDEKSHLSDVKCLDRVHVFFESIMVFFITYKRVKYSGPYHSKWSYFLHTNFRRGKPLVNNIFSITKPKYCTNNLPWIYAYDSLLTYISNKYLFSSVRKNDRNINRILWISQSHVQNLRYLHKWLKESYAIRHPKVSKLISLIFKIW